MTINDFKEFLGKGIEAHHNGQTVKVGSASFVNHKENINHKETAVYISFNDDYKGKFVIKNSYRKGLKSLFNTLKNAYELAIVSGDNVGEKHFLSELLPQNTTLMFDKKPADKLDIVAKFQSQNKKVAMIGDGLNDAGALAKSDVGIALSENINVFSPACDAILDASQFEHIDRFLMGSKKALKIIKYCFVLSLCYNIVGLYFAVTGQLIPVVAAILMPLSSISIVIFTSIATNFVGKKI